MQPACGVGLFGGCPKCLLVCMCVVGVLVMVVVGAHLASGYPGAAEC